MATLAAMANPIIDRVTFWHAALGQYAWRLLVAVPFAVLSALTWLRDEFVTDPQLQGKLKMLSLLPNWSWQTWAVCALGGLLVLLLEGSYRAYRRAARDQETRIERRNTAIREALDVSAATPKLIALREKGLAIYKRELNFGSSDETITWRADLTDWIREVEGLLARYWSESELNRFRIAAKTTITARPVDRNYPKDWRTWYAENKEILATSSEVVYCLNQIINFGSPHLIMAKRELRLAADDVDPNVPMT